MKRMPVRVCNRSFNGFLSLNPRTRPSLTRRAETANARGSVLRENFPQASRHTSGSEAAAGTSPDPARS